MFGSVPFDARHVLLSWFTPSRSSAPPPSVQPQQSPSLGHPAVSQRLQYRRTYARSCSERVLAASSKPGRLPAGKYCTGTPALAAILISQIIAHAHYSGFGPKPHLCTGVSSLLPHPPTAVSTAQIAIPCRPRPLPARASRRACSHRHHAQHPHVVRRKGPLDACVAPPEPIPVDVLRLADLRPPRKRQLVICARRRDVAVGG